MIKQVKVTNFSIILQEDGTEQYIMQCDVLWSNVNTIEWFHDIGLTSTTLSDGAIVANLTALIKHKLRERLFAQNLQTALDTRLTQ